MHLSAVALRAGTADDAPPIAEVAVEGWRTYVDFAPDGWQPPTVPEELERVTATLIQPTAWCEVAEHGSRLVGHAILVAASEARVVDETPGLAHLFQLIVRPEHWGSGLAALLQAHARAAAAERGYATMRLFTPADHERARRFYEREGWALHRPPEMDPVFGMAIVEYRRVL